MEVKPNASTGAVRNTTDRAVASPRATAAVTDSASFQGADAVNAAVRQTPDVRPEAVAQARALIADQKYPPLSTINAISKLIGATVSQDNSNL